jgi:hypothetical protein
VSKKRYLVNGPDTLIIGRNNHTALDLLVHAAIHLHNKAGENI